MAASADWILKIIRTSDTEVKEMPHTEQKMSMQTVLQFFNRQNVWQENLFGKHSHRHASTETITKKQSRLKYITGVMKKDRYLVTLVQKLAFFLKILTIDWKNGFSTYRQQMGNRFSHTMSDIRILMWVNAYSFPGTSSFQMFLYQ